MQLLILHDIVFSAQRVYAVTIDGSKWPAIVVFTISMIPFAVNLVRYIVLHKTGGK